MQGDGFEGIEQERRRDGVEMIRIARLQRSAGRFWKHGDGDEKKRETGRRETNETNDSARARIVVERPRERKKEVEGKRAHGKDDEWGL